MNEFEEDIRDRKRLAQNARHKKGNRRGCTLPHEYLTKKELNKMNGELISLDMKKPITWKQFKSLPANLQTEYLQRQMDWFGVGLSTISSGLFGVGDSILPHYVRNHGLNLTIRTGGRATKAAMKSFFSWVESAKQMDDAATDPEPEPEATIAPVKSEPEEEITPLREHDYHPILHTPDPSESKPGKAYPTTDLSITLKGNLADVLVSLVDMLPAALDTNKEYRFQLKVDTYVLDRRIDL